MIVLTASLNWVILSPPVALNQLLTRQVVVKKKWMKQMPKYVICFYWRYERWILPCAVMAPALLLVAYVPLFFYAK